MDKKDIQDILPLNSNQQAFLFHILRKDRADPGIITVSFKIQGQLDQKTFDQAWNVLIQRHETLRMMVHIPSSNKPVIITKKSFEFASEWYDLKDLSETSQNQRISEKLAEEETTQLEISKPPVMRMSVYCRAPHLFDIVWTCHHLFLDGWSAKVLLQELVQIINSLNTSAPAHLPTIAPHKSYRAWLKQKSTSEADKFWATYLDNFKPVSLFDIENVQTAQEGASDYQKEMVKTPPALLSESIEQVVSDLQITPSALFYAGWSLVLSALGKTDDVVFGNTISGRSFDLTGAESMVGCFANVIPRRSTLLSDQPLSKLLKEHHRDQFITQPFENIPLSVIQKSSNQHTGEKLFDTMVVFENFPKDPPLEPRPDTAKLLSFKSGVTTTYPFTLVITSNPELCLSALYDDRIPSEIADEILTLFIAVIEKICANPTLLQKEILDWLSHELPDIKVARDKTSHITVESFQSILTEDIKTPKTPTEMEIAKIWQDVLGIRQVDVTSDFLMLGGRSFAATRMLSMIEARFEKRISLVDFIANPTIKSLAVIVDGGSSEKKWTSLIPIQPNGSRPPMTLVHAGGGHVLFARALCDHLGIDQPLYGLQPEGLDGECTPVNSIHKIADHYLAELTSAQPAGPYWLVGHCGGSSVALEMKRVLHLKGETAHLVILDALPPKMSAEALRPQTLSYNLNNQISHLLKGRIFKIFKAGYRFATVKLRHKMILKYGSPLAKKSVYLEQVAKACSFARSTYLAEKCDGHVTVFCPETHKEQLTGWQNVCDTVDTHCLPIGHETMFTEPEAGILAQNLIEFRDEKIIR